MTKEEAIRRIRTGEWRKSENNGKGNIESICEIVSQINELKWHTGTPTEREWVLGIFREADTGWINPIPFVCEYLQGLKTKATTEEGWIIKDIDQPCDYYKKLQCIAWQKITPYERGEVNG